MPLRVFAARLRDGSLPKDAYSFCDVGGTSLEGAAPFVAELFERLATHELPPKLRDEVRQPSHGLPGRVRLAFGGAKGLSDGNAFHNHGPAVNLLLAPLIAISHVAAAQVVTAVGGSTIDVAKPNSTAARIPEKRPARQKPCARYAQTPGQRRQDRRGR